MHAGGAAPGSDARGPVLRIIVENLFYPVTLEVLQQVLDPAPAWPGPGLARPGPVWPRPGPASVNHCLFADLQQVRLRVEDHHFHQEQPVSGPAAVQ